MSEYLYAIIDELENNNFDVNKIKNDLKANDKSFLKSLYKVLHISLEDHFSYNSFSSDLVYNTLKAIEEVSSSIKINSDEILRIERKKLEEIEYIKKLKSLNKNKNENDKEFKKIINKLENIIIYPRNYSVTVNNYYDFEYLINTEADIYVIKSYLFDNKTRIDSIKNNESIINLLCNNFVKYYNLKSEKMYYYLYILKILKPDKLSNTKIKNIYKNILKDTNYHYALRTFNILLNGKNLNMNEKDILELYNIKKAYLDNLKTISIKNDDIDKDSVSITIDPKKTSNVKDDALSIVKTKNEYIFGIHISNVAENLNYNDINILKDRFISLYLPNIVIDMIKEEDIKKSLSMDEGKDKNALSLIARFSKTGALKDFYFSKNMTKVIANYTYDDVDKILLKGKIDDNSKLLFDLYEITSILKNATKGKAKYRDIKENEKNAELNKFYEYDTISHGIIEEAMVLYNSLIAEYMYTNNYPFIYRNHEVNSASYDVPLTLRKYYNMTYGNSYYSVHNSGHSGLNVNYYSHSTSPMRRYVDIINQQLFLNPNYYNLKDLEKISKYSNEKEKTLKLVKDDYISTLNTNRKL